MEGLSSPGLLRHMPNTFKSDLQKSKNTISAIKSYATGKRLKRGLRTVCSVLKGVRTIPCQGLPDAPVLQVLRAHVAPGLRYLR
jgi:hypothetical protein